MGREFWSCSLGAYFLLNLLLSKTVPGEGMLLHLGPPALPKSHSVYERPRWPRGSWLW